MAGEWSGMELAVVTLCGLLMMACMATMALTLMSKRYVPAGLSGIASAGSLVLLVSPRYGISLKVVVCAAGVVVAVVLIGAANYWVKSRVVGWSMPFWSKIIRFEAPEKKN